MPLVTGDEQDMLWLHLIALVHSIKKRRNQIYIFLEELQRF